MASKMECSICLCDFTNPKIIDCFHTFCKTCLDDYISNKSENGHFPCPICRKSIRIPEQFTSNFYVALEAEVSESTIDDDESESRMCSNHMKEIDLYCKQCCSSMCYKCFMADHNGHSVSDLNDFKLKTKAEILALRGELENTFLKYEEYSESIQHQKKEIETQTSQICTRIDKRVDKLCAALRHIGIEMHDEVKQGNSLVEKKTASLESLANDLSTATKNLLKKITDDVDHIGVSELLVLKTKILREIEHGKQDLVFPKPKIILFQEGQVNKIQLTSQLGQIKPGMKKNDTKTARSHNLLNSGAASDNNLTNVEAIINKTCILRFNLDRERKIQFTGNPGVTQGGLCWWRYASICNNKLSLRLEVTVLDSFTGPLPNKILLKIELLNKRNHQLNKIKQSTIQLKETIYWEDIISMEKLENPSLRFVDDQRVFTFRLFVSHVTTKK